MTSHGKPPGFLTLSIEANSEFKLVSIFLHETRKRTDEIQVNKQIHTHARNRLVSLVFFIMSGYKLDFKL